MSNQILHSRKLPALVALGLLIVALVSLSGLLARAQSKKAPKKPILEEAVIREGRNRIRPRPGYELIKDSETTVVVRRKFREVVLGKFRCTVCPGSDCGTVTSSDGSASCAPSTQCSSNSCFIDPF
ncbi:MAG: hypothetical protein ACREEM_10295 [Blastocatellia bacterium]